MNTLKLTRSQFKRMEKNLGAPPAPPRQHASDLMVEFQHIIEKKLGRRLTPEEARSSQFRGDALAYAKTILRWTKKAEAK